MDRPSQTTKQYIYILALQHHCFYVGRTNNLPKRLQDHKKGIGKGAQWTRMNKPIKLLAIIDCIFREEEDMWTKKLMGHYSIHQVRGGAYSQVNLAFDQLFFLEKELRNSKNQCFVCGEHDHFAQRCPKKPQNQEHKKRFLEAFLQRHIQPKQNFGRQKSTQTEIQAEWKVFKESHLQGLPYFSNQFGCETYNYREGVAQQRQGLSKEYLQRPQKSEQFSLYVGAANSAFLLALAEALFLRPEVRLVARRTLLEVQKEFNPQDYGLKHENEGHEEGEGNTGAEEVSKKRNQMHQGSEDEDEIQLLRKLSAAAKKIKVQKERTNKTAFDQAQNRQYSILSPLKAFWGYVRRIF